MNVYLDYAATAPLRGEVLERMLPLLKENFGNPDSLHAYGRKAAYLVTEARDRVAALLGGKPNEVYFTSGGTEADNWAVRCLAAGAPFAVSAIEHAAVLSAAGLRGEHTLLPCSADGRISPAAVEDAVRRGARLVAVMAVNNETGVIQPVKELAAAAHAGGALFFCDAVQAGRSCDLKELTAVSDAVSLSAHKLGGPKGTGVLWVKRGVRLAPLIAGGEQERSLRGGTLNVAGIVGMAEALALASEEREPFCAHTRACRDAFEEHIRSALGDGVRIDGGETIPADIVIDEDPDGEPDGTVYYDITMRDDIVFSDGEPATIDDVIFGIYVYLDPTYDGNSTMRSLPIRGLEEYMSGMNSLYVMLTEAGRENTDFTYWTEEDQTDFWAEVDAAIEPWIQEIVDYCVAAEAVPEKPDCIWINLWRAPQKMDGRQSVIDSFVVNRDGLTLLELLRINKGSLVVAQNCDIPFRQQFSKITEGLVALDCFIAVVCSRTVDQEECWIWSFSPGKGQGPRKSGGPADFDGLFPEEGSRRLFLIFLLWTDIKSAKFSIRINTEKTGQGLTFQSGFLCKNCNSMNDRHFCRNSLKRAQLAEHGGNSKDPEGESSVVDSLFHFR